MISNKRTLKILILSYSSLFLLGLSDNIRGPLFPEILNQFSLSDSKGSLFFSLSSVMGFFGGFFSDRIIHRLGATGALRASILCMGTGLLIMGLSPSFFVLLFGVFFFGFSMGLMGVVQNMLVVQELPAGPLKNKVLSGLHSMYAGASLVAPLVVNLMAWLSSDPVSGAIAGEAWRISFWFAAGFCLLILAPTFYGPVLNDSLESPQRRQSNSEDRAPQIFFALILACYVLAEILVSSRMALYMRREYDSSLTESSWYTAIFFIALFVSRVIFTAWSPKMEVKKQLILSQAMTFLSLMVGIFVHPVGLAFSGFFMGPFYPLMMVQAGIFFPRSLSQALSWAVSLCSLFLVLMHVWFGLVSDILGLKAAFLMGPAFCLIGLVMIGTYEKVFRRLQHSF